MAKFQLVLWPFWRSLWPPIAAYRFEQLPRSRGGNGTIYLRAVRLGPFEWRQWRPDVDAPKQPRYRRLSDGVYI